MRAVRKSISVTISPDNRITVRCPKYYPQSKVRDFLQSKANWIERVVKNNELTIANNKGIFDYKEIYICGKKFPLIISDKDIITPEAVYIKDRSHIKKLFITSLKAEFLNYAEYISGQTGISAAEFTLKAYKSKWGCCDKNGKIALNYLLIMLPKDLQRYVIIHELCHTKYFNHSKLFWNMVSAYEPDYKLKRRKLKGYNFITNLY